MSHRTPALLDVRHLSKRFGRIAALTDVSFEVRAGEVLGLIGPNGSGKTTLFECVAGVLPRDNGDVVFGRDQTLFYVPDAIAPWPTQTVRWALDFTVGFLEGRFERVAPLTKALDLETLLDVKIGHLSKGQRKRALLAVGLLAPAPMLLIDEPFEGLDLKQTRRVTDLLRAQRDAGRTLFLSIHQISDAAHVCDRFILLGDGRVRGQGTLDELAEIAAAHGGQPANRDLEEIFLALT